MRRHLGLIAAALTVAAGIALLAVVAVTATGSGATPPPTAVVVLVGGSPQGGGCKGVVLLQVDYERPRVTLTVVAAERPAGDADGDSLLRLADARGPQAVADVLARRAGVAPGGWLWFDREGLQTLASGLLSDGNAVTSPPGVRAAALRLTPPFGLPPLPAEQVALWRTLLGGSWRPHLRVVSFENYVLAGGHANTDLGLRAVAALGRALRTAAAGDVGVAPQAVVP